ncbi:Protein transport protein SEC24 [Nakaseomyces bracarensis]|uniref:Protein transport protein SEC24 n=1 Tax=Nakaseomyces bracarensis TaxID=273131 RepID=A0ABR4NMV3_9SACH
MSHKKRVYPQAQFGLSQANNANGYSVDTPVLDPSAPLFTPAQEVLNNQIGAAADGIANMQLHNVPVVNQQQMYNQPSMDYQANNAYGAYGSPSPQTANIKSNQLYPVDLLSELPPPISDLNLPPPPIIVAPEKMIVPSESSNASSDYIRSTLNAVPKTNSLLKRSKLPFSLIIRPYQHLNDDINPPAINEDGLIVRCRRCRSYMNPFASFIEQGRRWRCNFCKLANDLPMQFDQTMIENNVVGRYERNEVKHAIMEYIAPKEYTVRQPPPSIYTFVLDVSQNAIKNGLFVSTISSIQQQLELIPNRDDRTRVSFICVDHGLHFVSIPQDDSSEKVRIMDVSDLDEPFLPLPNSLVVPISKCKRNIAEALEKMKAIFQENLSVRFALGPALKSAHKMIGGIGGKIITVAATLPDIGVGALKKRKENGVSGTSKESSLLLSCQDSFYKTFTVDCSKTQITVDLFLASDDYIDVATLSNLSRFTAGQTHFYPGYNAANESDFAKFTTEFSKHITMDISMETVMRARGSIGLKTSGFYGHFFNRSSDLCAFATMPRDQSYVFDISIEDTMTADYCFFQVAVLLSLNNGQRRIRVITLGLPTTQSISEVYAGVDQQAVAIQFAQRAVQKAFSSSIDDARDLILKSTQDILSTYKKELVVSNTGGVVPLKLSTNLRMLPLLIHALSKHMAFRAGVVPSDHRANALNFLESAPLKDVIRSIYPSIYSLHDMPDESGYADEFGNVILPNCVNDTSVLLERYGLYLIDNSSELFLWVGGDAVPELTADVFGVENIFQVQIGKHDLPQIAGSQFNERITNIIDFIRNRDDIIKYKTLYIVRGATANESFNQPGARELGSLRMWASSNLVEDNILKTLSYREFLEKMKKDIIK